MHILVTRPDPAGSALCALLNKAGYTTTHCPTINIEPIKDDTFLKAINAMGEQDWLIFTSPQAVYTTIPTLRAIWPSLPPHLQFAAIGEGTAKALQQAGYNVACTPSIWSSEGLLATPTFQNVNGKKIAIIKGVGGRALLATTLKTRGADIMYVSSYSRNLPEQTKFPTTQWMKEKKIDVIVCASFAAVQNLKELVGLVGFKYVQHIPLLVVSERIKRLAEDLQFQTIWVAKNASATSILACIERNKA